MREASHGGTHSYSGVMMSGNNTAGRKFIIFSLVTLKRLSARPMMSS